MPNEQQGSNKPPSSPPPPPPDPKAGAELRNIEKGIPPGGKPPK